MPQLELKVPPVLLVLIAVVLIQFAPGHFQVYGHAATTFKVAAAVALAAGIIIAMLGIVSFKQHQTTVNPMTPDAANTLVDSGVFQYTRNPMYVGMALVVLAFGLWLGKPLSLVILMGFTAYLTQYQIIPEERALQQRFGDSFDNYCASVKRWL
ncbi:methyltransferase family protein [Echinimonas agarilytica]|uniref:Isoprenylcysteine carboxylmethyltransferase family protein n=1 Tax=Echinimonas agarilytica TaxID=1215918 RepID=A0AA41W7X9_9GAMM|nr:isoprenylcysteine carboxylmethyltransferase family protein [Echinimonas agarilytica]MCM2680865.1 isoprenylcysteine carboxylmethyltransferase family protein [Echinimonas agarilytica]